MSETMSELLDKIPEKRCEKCKHYNMIDGGYGTCRRFPPQVTTWWEWDRWWWRQYYDCNYPDVAWIENACGEFINNKNEV